MKVSGISASAGSVAFLGVYVLISRALGLDNVGVGVGIGGGGSIVERTEFRLLSELKMVGGDFIEKPERVRPWLSLLGLYPPPGLPLCGAVRGLSMMTSGTRGIVGAAALVAIVDCRLAASFFDRDC